MSARAILLALVLLIPSCTRTLATRLVSAQNLNSSARGVDANDHILEDHLVTRQLRVSVGPPDATLAVWILDPIASRGRLSFVITPIGYSILKLNPETTSTSAPTTAPKPKATLFILHGITDNKENPPYQVWATALRVAGYRIVLVDLRGHGRSTGEQITYGAVESRDLTQLLDVLERDHEIMGPVGVLGGSYGASVAIQWAAADPRVKAVVALEPFDTLRHAAADVAPILLGKWRWLFSDRAIQTGITQAGQIAHFDPDRSSPLHAIARCQTPILLIHGRLDDFLTPSHSERLHAAAPDHTKLILVPYVNHFTLWHNAFERIHRESMRFFNDHLSPMAPNVPATMPGPEQPGPELSPIAPTSRPERAPTSRRAL
jgi:pimeloyl-ACP methyl ester carboxylesterase